MSALIRAKTGEVSEKLPRSLLVEGEHLWFEWESVSGNIMACCRWCGKVMPRKVELRGSHCRGVVKVSLR